MHESESSQKPVTEEAIAEAVSQLSGKSQDELFDALRAETEKERAMGRLNDTGLEEIYKKLSPMLTAAQRAKMQEVIRRLKS